MKMICSECKQKSEDGILQHLDTCSGAEPKIRTDYIRPPVITIKFDDKKEHDRFFKNLTKTRGNQNYEDQE